MNNKITNSLKWSTGGEVLAKIIAPLVNMILARILAPENFGILATVNMIISFVDLFTDSGFAKYIIQCDFDNEKEKNLCFNIAFWTNLTVSIVLYLAIVLFKDLIAIAVGNPGYGNVISFAGIQIIITAFSTVHMAILKRDFDFKTLFIIRIITALVPLVITVPLAFILKNYWSLIIGTTISQLIAAIILVVKSEWRPSLYYSVQLLRKMLSFSLWSLAEALSYWLITWVDIFIIGTSFSAREVGLYKNSINMVNSLLALVKASIMPVLFSVLSRLKNSASEYSDVYFTIQRMAAYILIPMGFGIFLFRSLATYILFGSAWSDASNIIGAWAFASSFTILFMSFNGEAYKSAGTPRTLFVSDILYLAILIPMCLISKNQSFWTFVYVRSLSVVIEIIISMGFMKAKIGFSIGRMISNISKPLLSSCFMLVFGLAISKIYNSVLWQIISLMLCMCVYTSFCFIFYKRDIIDDFVSLKKNYTL